MKYLFIRLLNVDFQQCKYSDIPKISRQFSKEQLLEFGQ